ncbi:MAG: hypothetical protein ABIN39_04745 [candidate division WOR-3 bacterium]
MIIFLIFILGFFCLNLNGSIEKEYLVGWYLNNDEKISKSFLGIDGGYYKDDFTTYYDIFIQYTLYNREKDLTKIDPLKFQPLLNLPHTKYVIITLPSYSTFSRNLFSFFNSDSNNISILKYGKVFLINKNSRKILDEENIKNYISTFWDKEIPTYGVLKVKDLKKDEKILIEIYKDKIFNLKSNAAVNIYFDIFGLSYKLLNKNSYINIIFDLSFEDSFFHFIIGNRTNTFIDQKYKNFIRTDFNISKISGSKKINISKQDREKYILNLPSDQTLDTIWQTFQFNIKDFLDEKFGLKNYRIVGLRIILKDTYLGNFNFSYKNQKKVQQAKFIVDSLCSLGDKRIIGFYLEDEIEPKTIINLDRWFFEYRNDIYKNNLLKRNDETTIYYINEIIDYIKSKNHIPFVLHSAQFYDYKNDDKLKLMMFEDTSFLITSDYIMFDDYLYDEYFLKRFKKIYDFAKQNSKKILYIGDAYKDIKNDKLKFDKIKWRFFSPYILGSNGIIFYAYYYNNTDSREKFQNDFYKQKIGLFSKFLSETSLKRIENSKEFFVQKGSYERYSKIVLTNDEKIFFLYLTNTKDENYPLNCQFDLEDEDMIHLKTFLHEKKFKIYQVNFKYFENPEKIKEYLLPISIKNETGLIEIFKNYELSKFNNRFDIKITVFNNIKE